MKILIIIFALTSPTFTQEEDPLKYFPYKTGDMWEYFYYESALYVDTVQNFNIKDSLDLEGNIFLTQFARTINPIQYPYNFLDTSFYKIDSSFYVFGQGPISENDLIYKINAEQGDKWIIYDYSQGIGGNGYELATLLEVREDELFGIQTTFKTFVYYFAQDSTDTLGLVRYADVLAYGFGLYSRGGGDLIGDIDLIGCVINDTLYGDTTNIITSVNDLSENYPNKFELDANYPNPFNPSTTITFRLNTSDNISLIVYDVIGREVKRLIDNKWTHYGNHRIIWDGKSNSGQITSSGIYYYSLISNGLRITHSMILLK